MVLDEIIDLLADDKGSLTSALLKTKVLLHQIDKRDLVDWVNAELNGYPDGVELPPYRVIPCFVRANLSNPVSRYRNHAIPIGHLDEQHRENLQTSSMGQSLAILENLVKSNAEGGRIARPLPMELNAHLGAQLGNGFHIEQAWCEISASDIMGIFTHVRSRLLDFLLALKDVVGEPTSASEMKEKTKSVDTASMFNNAVFGPNTTILVGHQSTINATQTLNGAGLAEGVQKLISQLEGLLPESGLPAEVQRDAVAALVELREASTAVEPEVSRLRRGLEALKHIMEHAGGHLVATGALALIAQLLGHAAH